MGLKKSHQPKTKTPQIAPTMRGNAHQAHDTYFVVSDAVNSTDTLEASTPTTGESQNTETQLTLIPQDSRTSTFSPSAGLARIYQLLAKGWDWNVANEVHSLLRQLESFGIRSPHISSLKTSLDCSPLPKVKELTSTRHLPCSPTLGMMCNGKFLIQGGFSPKIESGYTLSDILEESVDQKYFLSQKQISSLTQGIQQSQIVYNPQDTQAGTIEE